MNASRIHVQAAPFGPPGRMPFGLGRLEVLHISRAIGTLRQPTKGDPEESFVRASLQLEGRPGSSRSSVRRARVAFVDPSAPPPLSRVDPARGLLQLYYPISAYTALEELLRSGRERFCYCWLSPDSTRSLVMMMATR